LDYEVGIVGTESIGLGLVGPIIRDHGSGIVRDYLLRLFLFDFVFKKVVNSKWYWLIIIQ